MSIGSGEFQFVFTTRAELAGARQVEEQIQRDIGKAKALGQSYTELEDKLKRVQSAIASAGKPEGPGVGEMFTKVREGLGDVVPGFAKLDGLLSKFAGGAVGAVAGGFAVLAGVFETVKHSLNEFAEAQEQVAKQDAALAQAGLLYDAYREKLQALAQEMQDATAIADEKWLAVLTRLTQFGARPENIERYADAVKNLAGLMGGDVESAGVVFSKAIQGNFAMLTRYGIQVDESKSKTEQLKQVMDEIALRGAGQLEAAARGLTGQWKQLGLATADLAKGIGHVIADTGILQSGLTFLTDAFSYWAEKLDSVIEKLPGLENAARATTQTMEDSGQAAKSFATALKEVETKSGEAAQATERYISTLKALQQIQNEIEDASMALELSKVTDEGSAGLQKKADIRQRYAEQKYNREQAALKVEIDKNQSVYSGAAGEVLGLSQAKQDKKEQIDYKKQIDSTEFALKGRVTATAEARKEWEKAAELAATERAKNPAAVNEARERLFGPSEYDEDAEAKKRALDNATAEEQKSREKLRALKGAPGVSGKSVAELESELNRINGRLEGAEKALADAEGKRNGNFILERQMEANTKIYGLRSTADHNTSSSEVGKARQQEATKYQQAVDKDNAERARYGFDARHTQAIQQGAGSVVGELAKTHAATVTALGSIAHTLAQQRTDLTNIVRDLQSLSNKVNRNQL